MKVQKVDFIKNVLYFSDVNKDVFENPSEYILCTSVYREEETLEVNPPPGSIFILSESEPYSENRMLTFNRLLSWLLRFGLPIYQIHSSGHILPFHLRGLIEDQKPKEVFIVHTLYPHAFKSMVEDLNRVVIPNKGDIYPIT